MLIFSKSVISSICTSMNSFRGVSPLAYESDVMPAVRERLGRVNWFIAQFDDATGRMRIEQTRQSRARGGGIERSQPGGEGRETRGGIVTDQSCSGGRVCRYRKNSFPNCVSFGSYDVSARIRGNALEVRLISDPTDRSFRSH